MTLHIKPTHKVITDYYPAIHQAKDTNQLHEGVVAPHFAALLGLGAFKDKVGELGQSLVKIISNELKISGSFKRAFDHFSDLCRSTINPNLAPAAIIEMLVQHLLTERIFRTVFNNPDFIHNNVIAREIETVIRALTSRSFNRNEFLKNLDRFYLAIEETASTIHSYNRKQDFLNTVYENFFQGFAVKVADTHGIVYTPQPIVDFGTGSLRFLTTTN